MGVFWNQLVNPDESAGEVKRPIYRVISSLSLYVNGDKTAAQVKTDLGIAAGEDETEFDQVITKLDAQANKRERLEALAFLLMIAAGAEEGGNGLTGDQVKSIMAAWVA